MKKVTFLMGLALLAACPTMSFAQGEVMDNTMSSYDVSSLKGGEWVETETKSEYPGYAPPASKSKMACVKADGDHVWIENTAADMVTCYQIKKSDRKILAAWTGKAGGTGTALKVTPAPTAGATPPANYEMTGTSKGSKEKLAVAGKDVECVKVVSEITMKMSGTEMKSKSTIWYSTEHPFKTYVDKEAKDPNEGKIKHEGDKPEGNFVKMESEASGGKTTMAVCGWGADAKPTLTVK